MKRILCFLIPLSVILVTSLLAQSNERGYISGEVIVKFHRHVVDNPSFKVTNQGTGATTGIGSIDKIGQTIGATKIIDLIPQETKEMVLNAASLLGAKMRRAVLEDKHGLRRTYIVKISIDVAEAVKLLQSDPNVEYVGPNHWAEATTTPNDPSYSEQWNLPAIHAPEGWNISTGSSDIKIGIIDSGVDLLHPDLIANLYQGFDFVRQDTNALKNDGYTLFKDEDYTEADDNPMDFNGHGTNVAGTAGAVTNNSTGVAGVMWNCKIVPLRAGSNVIRPNEGTAWSIKFLEADIAFAIHWSFGWGVHVINMSFSTDIELPMVRDAINEGHDTWGMVFVASAGNTGSNEVRYPAAYPNVIAVGGSNMTDFKHPVATYGSMLSVAAPVSSYNTAYDPLDRNGNGLVHEYLWYLGTSQATPLVSGLAGLILAVKPSLARSNPEQVRSLITNNADKTGGYNYNWDPNRPGHSLELGYGRINVYQTLTAAQNLRKLPAGQSSEASTVKEEIPKLSLENFPDPFNPTTKVKFNLPEKGTVRLVVFDLLGRTVSILASGEMNAGSHIVEFDGTGLSSGVYFSRLEFGSQVLSRKMLLQK